jgi:hypothetical protein
MLRHSFGLLAAFFLLAHSFTETFAESVKPAGTVVRKPSSHCIYDFSVTQTFDHLLTTEERADWVNTVCNKKADELAKQCEIGIEPKELKRYCWGNSQLMTEDQRDPLLESGPESIEETKEISGDADSRESAQKKLDTDIKLTTTQFAERFKAFEGTCSSLNGVPLSSFKTETEFPRIIDAEGKKYRYSAILKSRATCHKKRNANEFRYETALNVRFWK